MSDSKGLFACSLSDLVAALETGSLDEAVVAMDAASSAADAFLRAAVDRFRVEPNREFIAERLVHFGSAIVPFLLPMLESADRRLALLSALTLLHVGDKSGVHVLLDALEAGDEWSGLIASKLANARIRGSCAAIVRCVERTPNADVPLLNALLGALESLDCEMPAHLVERFDGPDRPAGLRPFGRG